MNNPFNTLNDSTISTREEILKITDDIADSSYKNCQRLNTQGEIIDGWNREEVDIKYNLEKSNQHMNKIDSFAHGISKFFTRSYWKPTKKEEIPKKSESERKTRTLEELTLDKNLMDLQLNSSDQYDFEFEKEIKKRLDIIKNFQNEISNQLDEQNNELKEHQNSISNLKSKINHLDQRIDKYI